MTATRVLSPYVRLIKLNSIRIEYIHTGVHTNFHRGCDIIIIIIMWYYKMHIVIIIWLIIIFVSSHFVLYELNIHFYKDNLNIYGLYTKTFRFDLFRNIKQCRRIQLNLQ